MELTIKFNSKGSSYYAVQYGGENIGLKQANEIRKDSGVNLELDRIKSYINSIGFDPEIQVSENYAIESSLFEDCCNVTVRVEGKHLNKFLYNSYKYQVDQKTGEIQKAWIEKELDKNKVLEAWKDAGFPLEWGFKQPKEEPKSSIDDEFLQMAHKGDISTETMQQVVNVLEARMFDGGEEA